MYKTAGDAATFMDGLKPLVAATAGPQIVVCAPYTALHAAIEAARGSNIDVGAQDLFWLKEGAYTGEVSGPMLAAAGCKWVIVGHSERRQYFGETDETVFKKTGAALEAGLHPIVCVGERLEDREAGHTETVLAGQFAGGLARLSAEQFARIVIAYEPVWAIGTGKTATPGMAAAAHSFLRGQVAAHFGTEAAEECRILYGGSVNAGNSAALMEEEELDGALVGGASLDPNSFAAIVKSAQPT